MCRPERLRRPLVERGAVEADLAARRRPDADQRAGQRGLAGGARADDAERLCRPSSRKVTSCTHDLLLAGRHDAHALDREARLGGAGSAIGSVAAGNCASKLAAAAASSGGRRRSPASCAIASSTGASARDARIEPAMMMPARRLLRDHQIGADAEHRRLQHHAQHLRDGAEAAGDVGCASAGCVRGTGVGLAPHRGEARPPCPWPAAPRRCAGSPRRARCALRAVDGGLPGRAAGQDLGQQASARSA